jgi:starch phosphorylase
MAVAKDLSNWSAGVKRAWHNISVKDVIVSADGENGNGKLASNKPYLKVGTNLKVKAEVELGDLRPADVAVQLYNGPLDSWGNISMGSAISMNCQNGKKSDNSRYWFEASVPCESSGQLGLSVRVVPNNEYMASPWELCLIHWEGQGNN